MTVFSGKWKAIILYHIAEAEVLRFSEIRRGMNGITERMLAKQLRELEADGVVSRHIYNQIPPKVEYRLTDIGRKLIPILNMMKDWGIEYEEYLGGREIFASAGYEQPDNSVV
jgi:DNA-binding HxlR family transcriptional regulator